MILVVNQLPTSNCPPCPCLWRTTNCAVCMRSLGLCSYGAVSPWMAILVPRQDHRPWTKHITEPSWVQGVRPTVAHALTARFYGVHRLLTLERLKGIMRATRIEWRGGAGTNHHAPDGNHRVGVKVSGPRNLLSLSEAVLTWLDDGDPP